MHAARDHNPTTSGVSSSTIPSMRSVDPTPFALERVGMTAASESASAILSGSTIAPGVLTMTT